MGLNINRKDEELLSADAKGTDLLELLQASALLLGQVDSSAKIYVAIVGAGFAAWIKRGGVSIYSGTIRQVLEVANAIRIYEEARQGAE